MLDIDRVLASIDRAINKSMLDIDRVLASIDRAVDHVNYSQPSVGWLS